MSERERDHERERSPASPGGLAAERPVNRAAPRRGHGPTSTAGTAADRGTVRGFPGATISTPITWDEVDDVEPGGFTTATVPRRFAEPSDLHASIDEAVLPFGELLNRADRDEQSRRSRP